MPDRLAEIRARLDGATPGPWVRQDWACGDIAVVPEQRNKDPHRNFIVNGEGAWDDDIAFIAHAPTDIAWLLDEVERLEKRVRMYEVVKS
jgi:hypothetical protein